MPSRLQPNRNAAEQYRAAARSRQQPDGGVRVALPRRGILGANLDRGASDRHYSGKAECGTEGNYDGHDRSLQASFAANH
jgi:hypothetical protein